MFTVLSHTSALQFYRTPPIVHNLYELYPCLDYAQGKRLAAKRNKAGEHPFGSIEFPLHLLLSNKTSSCASGSYLYHIWSHELVPGMINETDYGISVASPLFTLMGLASKLHETQITMLLYELMGSFTVYKPTPELRDYLNGLIESGKFDIVDGWKPALGTDGKLTNLWQRPPIVQPEELNRWFSHTKDEWGVKKLRNAARDVFGVALSPFEVKAAMLLGMPRRRGGAGFGPVEMNKRIRFSSQAQRISKQSVCYADLYFEANDRHAPLIIECQGNAYHSGIEKSRDDDNRTMALQSMGYNVLRLRPEQIIDETALEDTVRVIARLLGTEIEPKSEKLKKTERSLLANLSIDWWDLGRISRAARKKR